MEFQVVLLAFFDFDRPGSEGLFDSIVVDYEVLFPHHWQRFWNDNAMYTGIHILWNSDIAEFQHVFSLSSALY